MALLQVNHFSEKLRMQMPLVAILPQPTQGQIGINSTERTGDVPVLWLLHGLSDDQTTWLRRTRIDVYAEKYGIAVIMPTVHRSFYQDTHAGLAYFNYICEEMPAICARFFRISTRPEDNYIAGHSMGGYGTMRCALTQPERYAAAYSFSGALDIRNIANHPLFEDNELNGIFGKPREVEGSASDLFHLAEMRAQEGNRLPRLYGCCGVDDFLIGSNRSFHKHAQSVGLPYEYYEDAGAHDWDYWEAHIEGAIRKLLGID